MQEVADIAHGVHFYVAGGIGEREKELRQVFYKIATERPVMLVD